MVNDFWLKNKHTISIFQAQVRDLAKHIEAQPKKHNAYKKNVYCIIEIFNSSLLKKNIEAKNGCKFDKMIKEKFCKFHEPSILLIVKKMRNFAGKSFYSICFIPL